MKRSILLLLFVYILFSGCIKPHHDFGHYTPPPAPDYSQESAWAALPWRHDAADTVPVGSGLKDEQDSAKVDVFFIYPTLDFSGKSWNADINDTKLNHKIEETTIRHQATVFNGSCKVYAPRYRQGTLYSFIDKGDNGKKALDLAYSDIRQAFIYYMKHFNKGRPFIIAGHSQGALMTYRLLKEFVDTTALRQKLVAAYPIGYRVKKDSLKNLKPGDSATETGCYITWNTVEMSAVNSTRAAFFKGVCINPLTWKRDTGFVSREHNLGSLSSSFKLVKGAVGAECNDGVLAVDRPSPGNGYFTFAGSYHIFDYSLFYMNLRVNVAQRVKAYLDKHPK